VTGPADNRPSVNPCFVFKDLPRDGLTVALTVVFDIEHRPCVTKVEVSATGDAAPVTPTDLRTIPIYRLVHGAIADKAAMMMGNDGDDVLRTVAAVYSDAVKRRRDGIGAIAAYLGIGRSTAANRLREARLLRLIPGPPDREWHGGGLEIQQL
jgi:hypothetical protein